MIIKRCFKYIKRKLKYHLFYLRLGKLISFNEFSSNTLSNNKILWHNNVHLFFSKPLFDNFESKNASHELMEGKIYTQYAVHLKNASIFGGSNLIINSNNNVLYDLPFYDNFNKFVYSDSNILFLVKNIVAYKKRPEESVNKAIWMGGNYSWNYFHLLFEILIKFVKLKTLNLPLDIPILIDSVCLKIPQYKELINILNKDGHTLLPVCYLTQYRIKDLIFINIPHIIPPGIKNDKICAEDIQLDVISLKKLRNILLEYSSQKIFPKRIFISRKNASGRRSFNENEIIEVLNSYNFEVIYPEELSIFDQLSLFNQAEFIIGGSGAAFANLLFCNSNCKAIILSKSKLPFSGFSTIANSVEMDLRYITEEAISGMALERLHDSFAINPSYFKDQIIKWGIL